MIRCFVPLTVLLLAVACQPSTNAAPAVVRHVTGTATVDGKSATVGMAVADGAVLRAGPASRLDIGLGDGTILRLDAGAELVLGRDGKERFADLRTGALLTFVKKLDGADRLSVRTKTAVVGVRGTAFYSRSVDAKTTVFCACNGVLRTSSPDEKAGRELAGAHHTPILYLAGSAGQAVKDMSDMGHTDKDMEELAAAVGATIDWTKIPGK